MIKPFWGIAAVAFLGTTGVVAAVVATLPGGTEEAVQVQKSSTPGAPLTLTPSPVPSVTPAPTAPTSNTPPPATSTPTPAPGGQAPGGCVAGESVYEDPAGRFAFCYPSSMQLVTTDTGEGTAVTVMHPLNEQDRLILNFGWASQGRVGIVQDAPCIDSDLIIKNRRITDLNFDGRTGKACFQDHYDPKQPATLVRKTIDIEVPLPTGAIEINATYTGPDWLRDGKSLQDIANRALDSAKIY